MNSAFQRGAKRRKRKDMDCKGTEGIRIVFTAYTPGSEPGRNRQPGTIAADGSANGWEALNETRRFQP